MHVAMHGPGAIIEMSQKQSCIKISDATIDHFLDFMLSPNIISDIPFGQKKLKLSTGQEINMPSVIMMHTRSKVVRKYIAYCKETGIETVGERTLLRMMHNLGPKLRRSMAGLDNYAADGGQAFDDLKELLIKLFPNSPNLYISHLDTAKHYLKMDSKPHIMAGEPIASHCVEHALTDNTKKEFKQKCTSHSEHTQKCQKCDELEVLLTLIRQASDSLNDDETSFVVNHAVDDIRSWRAHILRSVHQDKARTDTLLLIGENGVLIENDWAMKFLPERYREKQSQFFAKRGFHMHVSVVFYVCAISQQIETITIVHLFNSCTQDAATTAGVIMNTIDITTNKLPHIKNVYLRADNVGCYHSNLMLAGCMDINSKRDGIIKRFDFCDPQAGKCSCDRRIGDLKERVRRYRDSGKNILCANDLLNAIISELSDKELVNTIAVECSTPMNKDAPCSLSIPMISKLNNFEFKQRSIRVWRQYRIGVGENISVKKDSYNGFVIPLTPLVETDYTHTCPQITEKRVRVPSEVPSEYDETTLIMDDKLFGCPIDGCTMVYMRHANLIHHLDIGKHKFQDKNPKLLSDRTMSLYAIKLNAPLTEVPQMITASSSSSSSDTGFNASWGLKESKVVKRFNPKQKDFLLSQYMQGERRDGSGKVSAIEVSKNMRKLMENGKKKFTQDEFLTETQIASYFSRMTQKRKADKNTDENDIAVAVLEEERREHREIARK